MFGFGSQLLKQTSAMRILVVAPRLPRPDVSSGDRRFFGLLELLAKDHELFFWSPTRIGSEGRTSVEYETMLAKAGVRLLPPWHGDIRLALVARVYDLVYCEFWRCAEAAAKFLRRFQPWAYFVTDSVDVHFLRAEAGLSLGVGDACAINADKERELAVYRASDVVVVVTEEDRQALDSVGGVRRQVVVPNLVTTRQRLSAARDAQLLFIGGFWHLPNVDGILWFIREIFPLIRAAVPAAKLTIVGSNAPPEVKDLGEQPGVQFVGHVRETDSYLDRAAVSVAPLRFGAGMKGKVTEAMAAAMPVATTTVGAQGLGARSGEQLMIGDTPEEFAANVVALLRDPGLAARIGADAQVHIQRLCGIETVAGSLKTLISPEFIQRAPRFAAGWLLPSRVWCLLVSQPAALVRGLVCKLRAFVRHRMAKAA